MTRLDEIIASALAGIPETDAAILAREVVRLREAQAVVVPELLAVEKFADNGSHSHWIIIRRDTGGAVWEEPDPDEDSRTEIPLLLQSIPADLILGEGMAAISESLATLLQELVFAVDAFLAESSPWIGPGAPAEVPELTEIASRRLQYMLDQIRSNQGGAAT